MKTEPCSECEQEADQECDYCDDPVCNDCWDSHLSDVHLEEE
jgi:hypothetical protein